MIRLRRRNTLWLAALGVLIAIALISAVAAPELEAALLGIFALSMIGSFIGLDIARGRQMLENVQRAPTRARTSPQAREAVERAERRGGYSDPDIGLLDVGLITLQSSEDGMVMRRTRTISKDEDGVRPFIVLNVAPAAADRSARVRFEIYDHTGDEQYIYEMRTYLRDGEMNILADHHLPLMGNSKINGTGDWDLRVYIDNNLVGIHNFMLAPSLTERRRRLSPEAARDRGTPRRIVRQESDLPVSLEELLRSERASAEAPPAEVEAAPPRAVRRRE